MYGGTLDNGRIQEGFEGLSPRVRGNPCRFRRPVPRSGSIPACTGEPLAACRAARDVAVYPRVYGGTQVKSCRIELALQMRSIPACTGEPISCSVNGPSVTLRSIPACTGEPSKPRAADRAIVAGLSPRVRGNHGRDRLSPQDLRRGLSPRVRGNRSCVSGRSRPGAAVYPRVYGGTDASDACRSRLFEEVYPRVYGGTLCARPKSVIKTQVYPRVYGGTPWHLPVLEHKRRSIPACTGEPMSRDHGRTKAGTVYPRVYGGTLGIARLRRVLSGLSPRVRGNPRAGLPKLEDSSTARSIPACTGEPLPGNVAVIPACT